MFRADNIYNERYMITLYFSLTDFGFQNSFRN